MLVGRADDGKQAAPISASTMVCCGVVSCSQAHISAKFIGRNRNFWVDQVVTTAKDTRRIVGW